MARVRLVLRGIGSSPGAPFYQPGDRSGAIHHIPQRRLFAGLFVLPRDAADRSRPDDLSEEWSPEAILDTGASFTIFPYAVWQPFRDVIRWLNQPPGTRRVTILGGNFTYRLGRVRFGVIDEEANWLPAAWTNTLFLDDYPDAPRQAVLGLRTRLFDQRQVRCEVVPAEPLGQVWWLEDAMASVSR